MRHRRDIGMAVAHLLLLVALRPAEADAYKPWDELTPDSWIDFFDGNDPNIYPANAADSVGIAPHYPLAFSPAGGTGKARGMNALKFVHAGVMDGHLVSADPRGSFKIRNSGDSNVFTDVLIVVAIEAEALTDPFGLSLNLEGQPPYRLGPAHFAYQGDSPGRPSGYYSATDPNREPLTYAFGAGMVTVYGVEGLSAGLAPGQDITILYVFDHLSAPAVFSVYGFVGTDPLATIYHTNKALPDNNDPGGAKNSVSTFAVTVSGDLNRDLRVDFLDMAILAENWLMGAL